MNIRTRPPEHGLITICNPDGTFEKPIMQCPHCGGYWIHEEGSKRVRKYCFQCSRWTCGGFVGGLRCLEHNPIEQRLDLVEAGKIPASML